MLEKSTFCFVKCFFQVFLFSFFKFEHAWLLVRVAACLSIAENHIQCSCNHRDSVENGPHAVIFPNISMHSVYQVTQMNLLPLCWPPPNRLDHFPIVKIGPASSPEGCETFARHGYSVAWLVHETFSCDI